MEARIRTTSPRKSLATPAVVMAAGKKAGLRFLEFFTANIRNPNPRRAYNQWSLTPTTGCFWQRVI
jgi:hypothetical protein